MFGKLTMQDGTITDDMDLIALIEKARNPNSRRPQREALEVLNGVL